MFWFLLFRLAVDLRCLFSFDFVLWLCWCLHCWTRSVAKRKQEDISKTFCDFMRFIFDFHCLKYQKEIMMNSPGRVDLSGEKFMSGKIFQPWEKQQAILLHKGHPIRILSQPSSTPPPTPHSRHSFTALPFIYNPLCALMARKKDASGVGRRWRIRRSVRLIERNIFVTIVVCFLCHGSMHNTSSWDPSRAKRSICRPVVWADKHVQHFPLI